MQKSIVNNLTIAVSALFLALTIFSCSKNEVDLSDLDETIFVRNNGADMPAHIYGNGSEKVFLILLHGGPGDNGLVYRTNTIRTEIEKNNAVVYFDQRGSGSSQGNYSLEDVSMDLMAEDVLALAKVIREKYGEDSRFFLLGHSWGGTLAPAVLLKNQNEFKGWIHVNGGHNHKGLFEAYRTDLMKTAHEQISLGNSIDYWENLLESVENIDTVFSIENQLALNRIALSVDPVLVNDDIINDFSSDAGNDTPSSNTFIGLWNLLKIGYIMDYHNGLNEITFTDRLPEITLPTLVLWGKHDHVVPLKFGYEAYDNVGTSEKELFIFERSGHSPMNTEPDLFADKVIEFINEHK